MNILSELPFFASVILLSTEVVQLFVEARDFAVEINFIRNLFD